MKKFPLDTYTQAGERMLSRKFSTWKVLFLFLQLGKCESFSFSSTNFFSLIFCSLVWRACPSRAYLLMHTYHHTHCLLEKQQEEKFGKVWSRKRKVGIHNMLPYLWCLFTYISTEIYELVPSCVVSDLEK